MKITIEFRILLSSLNTIRRSMFTNGLLHLALKYWFFKSNSSIEWYCLNQWGLQPALNFDRSFGYLIRELKFDCDWIHSDFSILTIFIFAGCLFVVLFINKKWYIWFSHVDFKFQLMLKYIYVSVMYF